MKKDTASIFRIYILPILVTLVVILIVPFVLLPQFDRIKLKNQEVKEGQERLSRLNKKISDLSLVDETSESIMLLELEKIIPGSKKLAPLIVGLRNMALESNLVITDMNFKPGRVDDEATKSATVSSLSKKTKSQVNEKGSSSQGGLIFIVKVSGSLENVKKFFSKLEIAKRLMGVETVKGEQDEEDSSKYRFELSVNAPFKPAKSEGDIVGEPLPEFTSAHKKMFDQLLGLKDYTNKDIPTVKTGVDNPFE